ncbi:MAG: SMC family ATPase [Veillonellaceae bacterium]|nr:SMC family ATPase [Veillonellaceae bacterium]
MKPIRLTMQAFGPYVARQEIDFRRLGERSFFLIHGPTGAGKTTVFDAICYGLYGVTSGGRDAVQMRSAYADENLLTEVRLDFSLGDKYYRVIRQPRQTVARLRGTGTRDFGGKTELLETDAEGNELHSLGDRHVTQAVTELIGFSVEQFCQVVLLPQGEFRRLLLAGSDEREKILAKLFATDVYARVAQKLREKAQELHERYAANEQSRRANWEAVGVTSAAELTAAVTAQAAAIKAAEDEVRRTTDAHTAAQQAVGVGTALAARFAELAAVRRELARLAAAEAAVRARAEDIRKLEAAATMRDRYTELDRVLQAGTRLRKESDAAESDREKKRQRAEFWNKEETELRAGKEAQQQRFLLKKDLADMAERVAKLQEVRGKERKAQATATASATLLATAEAEFVRAEAVLKTAQENRNAGEMAAAQTEAKERALEQARQDLAAFDAGEALCEQAKAAAAAAEAAVREATRAGTAEREAETNYRRLALLREQYAAAALANGLVAGEACPVCGATDHPAPAQMDDIVPTEAEWQAAEAALSEARQTAREQGNIASQRCERSKALAEQAAQAAAKLPPVSREELTAKLAQAETALEENRRAIGEPAARQQAVTAAESRLEELRGELAQARATEKAASEALVSLTERAVMLAQNVPEAYREGTGLQTELANVTAAWEDYDRRERAYATQADAEREAYRTVVQEQEERQRRIEEYRQEYGNNRVELLQRAEQAGIADLTELRTLLERTEELEELKAAAERERVHAAQQEKAQESLVAELANREEPNLEALQQAEAAAREAYRTATEELAAARSRQEGYRNAETKAQALAQELASMDATQAVVGRLAALAAGDGNAADARISFQRYVLAALLEDVLRSANERLRLLSHGRYRLERMIGTTDRRRTAGLDLVVLDYWSGAQRPANTLSGGETFLASLALALGLADTAQAYAGGIRLDTVFIDEGFGTLDGDALNEALRILTDLRAGGRLVGIISHVEELRQRIDTRLEIVKTESGSRAHWVLG